MNSAITKQRLLSVVIAFAIFISAFALIYLKDLNRRLFIHYQNLQQTAVKDQVEWGKLLLEQSTWVTSARIQRIAQEELNMVIPRSQDIVMVEAVGETLASK